MELKGPVFNSCSPGIPCVTPDTLRAVRGHADIRFYGQPVFLGSGEWTGASALQDQIPLGSLDPTPTWGFCHPHPGFGDFSLSLCLTSSCIKQLQNLFVELFILFQRKTQWENAYFDEISLKMTRQHFETSSERKVKVFLQHSPSFLWEQLNSPQQSLLKKPNKQTTSAFFFCFCCAIAIFLQAHMNRKE